jgi:hypothetical protein
MKLATFSHPFPPPKEALHDDLGAMTLIGRQWHQALYNRTGGASGIVPTVTSGLIAQGNSHLTAMPLTDEINQVDAVAAGTGVQFPQLQVGQSVLHVFNNGANPLKVYPPPGGRIDAGAVNAPYTLPAGKLQLFHVYSLTQLRSTQLG